MSDSEIARLLGQIDGKLDQVIDAAKEHRDDDVRRFTDVYKKLGEHDHEISQAKGAKSALLWAAGLVASLSGAAVAFAAKKFLG